MGAYKQYIGKYIYLLLDYEEDFPEYIGMTNNFVRRGVEHIGCSYGTKFADSIPKYLRKTRYRMMVFDFSQFEEVTEADLRILESYITSNFSAELSKPMKLNQDKQKRLEELLRIVGNVQPKFYEEIKAEKLRELGSREEVDWF
ncbi:MAG: hypothetical protein ACLSH8_15600 [Zhenhengia sp.]|jgi:predicted GIY-YIG superfamily endonuclease|uniref:hypothetical protein n=1 Tax=Zhenhengia sp. TaxID=2944208 RepID=UPI00290D75AE|nr:hypothetical protein [Clostridiales bacterium]MDU6974896.1 hypothetical protein [Clostridiales bacterium]